MLHDPIKLTISTVPRFPCKELMQKTEFQNELETFRQDFNARLTVLLGPGDMIVYPSEDKGAKCIREKFAKNVETMGIILQHSTDALDYYSRVLKNVSRKQILPLIQEAIKEI